MERPQTRRQWCALAPQAADDDPPAPAPPCALNLDDARTAFRAVPTRDLARAAAVLGACAALPSLVARADGALAAARAAFGRGLVDAAVKATLFEHFCAGESAEAAARVAAPALAAAGVRAILNYSGEDATASELAEGRGGGVSAAAASEAARDGAAAAFAASIALSDTSPTASPAIVALKLTALFPPDALEAGSAGIAAAGGFRSCADPAATARAALAGGAAASWDAGVARVHALLAAARAKGDCRVIVDAEHTHVQPAIAALSLDLMRRENAAGAPPLVLETFQCYLRETSARLADFGARARAEGCARARAVGVCPPHRPPAPTPPLSLPTAGRWAPNRCGART